MTSQALNRPVDVLDVLDVRRHLFVKQSTKNANAAFLDWRDWCNYLPEADKARAAVAELIAAGDFLAMNGTDGMVRRWEAAKAAIGSQP